MARHFVFVVCRTRKGRYCLWRLEGELNNERSDNRGGNYWARRDVCGIIFCYGDPCVVVVELALPCIVWINKDQPFSSVGSQFALRFLV